MIAEAGLWLECRGELTLEDIEGSIVMSKLLTPEQVVRYKLALKSINEAVQCSLSQVESFFDYLSDDDKQLASGMLEKLGQEASDMAGEVIRMAQDTQESLNEIRS